MAGRELRVFKVCPLYVISTLDHLLEAMVAKLKAMGMTADTICEVTGLSLDMVADM